MKELVSPISQVKFRVASRRLHNEIVKVPTIGNLAETKHNSTIGIIAAGPAGYGVKLQRPIHIRNQPYPAWVTGFNMNRTHADLYDPLLQRHPLTPAYYSVRLTMEDFNNEEPDGVVDLSNLVADPVADNPNRRFYEYTTNISRQLDGRVSDAMNAVRCLIRSGDVIAVAAAISY